MNRSMESQAINNSSHLLQLVVFGVLHCSSYWISFWSTYEVIEKQKTHTQKTYRQTENIRFKTFSYYKDSYKHCVCVSVSLDLRPVLRIEASSNNHPAEVPETVLTPHDKKRLIEVRMVLPQLLLLNLPAQPHKQRRGENTSDFISITSENKPLFSHT